MDIKSLMSKLQSIESMTKIMEADDPAAVIAKYQEMGKKPTADMPAFIDPKDGKVKYMDQGNGMGGQPQIKVMPSDWIQRYAPDLAAALAAQGGNKQGYGTQDQKSLLGMKFNNGTTVNTKQAGADASSAKFKADKLKQLNDLIAKLNAEKGGNTDPTVGKVDYSVGGGAPGGTGLKLKESLIREFGFDLDEADAAIPGVQGGQGAMAPAPGPAAAPAAGGDIVSQIQAVMKELSDLGDDPEVAKALQSAQGAIDAKKAADSKPAAPAGSAALDGTKPGADPATTIPGGAETAAGGAGKPNAGSAAQPAASKGDPKVVAFQQELVKKGAKIKVDGVYGPATNAAAMQFGMAPPAGIKTTANAGGKAPAAPAGGSAAQPVDPQKAERIRQIDASLKNINPNLQANKAYIDKLNAEKAQLQGGGATQPAPGGNSTVAATNAAAAAKGMSGRGSSPMRQGAAAQPAAPATGSTTTTTNTSVNGTLKMGKADGPITYNGKTVNPGDPQYAAAEQALIQAKNKSQQFRKPSVTPATGGAVAQGATNADKADFEESVLHRIRQLAGM